MAVILWHCSIKLLTSSDLDFIFRKLRIPVFASSKARFFCVCESSFLHSFSGSMVRVQALFHRICLHISALAVKGTCPSKLSRSCFDKRHVQFGVWLCFALWWVFYCDGWFFFPMGFFSPQSISRQPFTHWGVKHRGAFLYQRSRVRVPHCLMLIMTITAKQFLVSLQLAGWAAVAGRVPGTVLWTCSISAVAAGWDGRCGHRELFQGQAEQRFWHGCLLLPEHRDLPRCGWVQGWAVPLPGMGQGPRAESLWTGFPCSISCALSQLPTPLARSRSRSGKGVDTGVLQGLGRKLGIATSCAWQALAAEFLTLGLLQFVYPEGIAVPLWNPSTALALRSSGSPDDVKNLRAVLSQMECQKDSVLQHILSCPKLPGFVQLCQWAVLLSGKFVHLLHSTIQFLHLVCRLATAGPLKMLKSKQQWHGNKEHLFEFYLPVTSTLLQDFWPTSPSRWTFISEF